MPGCAPCRRDEHLNGAHAEGGCPRNQMDKATRDRGESRHGSTGSLSQRWGLIANVCRRRGTCIRRPDFATLRADVPGARAVVDLGLLPSHPLVSFCV